MEDESEMFSDNFDNVPKVSSSRSFVDNYLNDPYLKVLLWTAFLIEFYAN